MSKPSPNKSNQGLWAFYKGQFFALDFHKENLDMDHACWFSQIGLPEFGPEFDQIVRGRLLWDMQLDRYVLLWYAYPKLPNRVYDAVVKYFRVEDHLLMEKPVFCDWM